ncbi:protein translocase subunit SecF [Moraxella catarrhalis]|uniref:Protein-export membrane protein SecF n=1 Tax=Moraxella catarrhalis TaxID=480 RepID=A0A198UH97_MORCA|nr:protein translocase subunit SecF [Moraxella catarrhalis]OAU94597.1 Protein-export membrane protein SecF [Moraxella catarrhalis]OAU95592.1 Protein-export membrane protein SecF [Moraxella catarrhalis]OAU96797.1 Protein-export membrane protein SecF [Moraxella catarrhalis]
MNNENNPIDPNAAQPPRRRRAPRRDGKGANAATNQNALADQSLIAEAGDEAAEKAGGVKLIANQRIIPFMKLEKPMMAFSVLFMLVGLIALIVKGLNFGLDFTGGVSANIAYEQPVEQAQVVQALADNGFNDAVVQYLGTRQELLVRLPPQDGSAENLSTALDQILNFPNNPSTIDSISIIGSQLGNEIYLNSLLAMSVALGMMLLYVATRFQFKLALGAVLALFHDVIIVVGVFAIMGWPFDLTVLAAVLALIGYSVNDTIVVYDRIRENFRRVRGLTPRQVLDLSLTETLRRTIMTVGTVFVVVVAMLFLGGDGLYWFSVALFIGLIAGTYSSVYIASSIPLMMGLSREDFVVKIKPEFEEEVVVFADPELQNTKD